MFLVVLGALAIGLSLGLLGSGGSILTVPVLHYLLHQPEQVAIGGSLLVVGLIATAACIPYALAKQVDWGKALWFGVPGMLGAWLGLPFTQKFFLNPRSNRAETDLGKGIAVLNSPAT